MNLISTTQSHWRFCSLLREELVHLPQNRLTYLPLPVKQIYQYRKTKIKYRKEKKHESGLIETCMISITCELQKNTIDCQFLSKI